MVRLSLLTDEERSYFQHFLTVVKSAVSRSSFSRDCRFCYVIIPLSFISDNSLLNSVSTISLNCNNLEYLMGFGLSGRPVNIRSVSDRFAVSLHISIRLRPVKQAFSISYKLATRICFVIHVHSQDPVSILRTSHAFS